MSANTVFATTENYNKGGVEITGKETPGHYLFSNMFEVAASAAPWERIVVAKNLEFTIEVMRAEGDSPWFICSHDETALLVQGACSMHFLKPTDQKLIPAADKEWRCDNAQRARWRKNGPCKCRLWTFDLTARRRRLSIHADLLSVC